jgi:hypothetical protein
VLGGTDRPSLVCPVLSCSIDAAEPTGDPGLTTETLYSPPLSFAAFHCFQAVLPNTSRSVFPSAGRRVHTGLPRGDGTCRTLQYQSLFPDPLTRPPDCRRQARPSLSVNLQNGLVPSIQATEYLSSRGDAPRPPSILDGRSAYRYAVLILLPPSQSHTMAHHPGFPILL